MPRLWLTTQEVPRDFAQAPPPQHNESAGLSVRVLAAIRTALQAIDPEEPEKGPGAVGKYCPLGTRRFVPACVITCIK